MILLVFIPLVLTIAALLFIMVNTNQYDSEYDSEENPFDDYDEEGALRVAVYEDKAYFVMNNVFYETEVTREPDFSTAKEVDTMSLPSKDLDKLLIILDELEEYGKEE